MACATYKGDTDNANCDNNSTNCEKEVSVKFKQSNSDSSSYKYHPTQKYNRKELQKRLDVEIWMDEQLRYLYGCTPDSENYPEMDLDDVLKIKEEDRKMHLITILKESKYPVDIFVCELLEKLCTLKILT